MTGVVLQDKPVFNHDGSCVALHKPLSAVVCHLLNSNSRVGTLAGRSNTAGTYWLSSAPYFRNSRTCGFELEAICEACVRTPKWQFSFVCMCEADAFSALPSSLSLTCWQAAASG